MIETTIRNQAIAEAEELFKLQTMLADAQATFMEAMAECATVLRRIHIEKARQAYSDPE